MDADAELDADLPEELTPWSHPWIASSRWLRAAFPALAVRTRRILAAVSEQLLPSAPDMVSPLGSVVGSVLADLPGINHEPLERLREHLAIIRRDGDAPPLQVAHCLLVSLDPCTPHPYDHPLLAGIRAAGWTRVPPSFVPLVVDLALAVRQWRGSKGVRGPDAALLDFQAFDVQLYRLATAAAALVGASLGLAWPRRTRAGGHRDVRDLPTAVSYFAALLPALSPDDPATLPLYEAYADACLWCDSRYVEDSARSLARSGAGEVDVLLRAAFRAWSRFDRLRALERAEAAFADGTVAQRTFAATLIALCRREQDIHAARAWFMTAASLCKDHEPMLLAHISEQLADLSSPVDSRRSAALGDDIRVGAQRSDLTIVADPGSVPRALGVGLDLRNLWLPLVHLDIELVSERLAQILGELVEARGPACATELAEMCCRACEGEMASHPRNTGSTIGARALLATVAAWLYAALADFHDHRGDLAGWRACKSRQLDLEDHEQTLPESFRHDLATWLAVKFGDAAATRVRQCLDEAELALAAGEAEKAGFWTERARYYRDRLKQPEVLPR